MTKQQGKESSSRSPSSRRSAGHCRPGLRRELQYRRDRRAIRLGDVHRCQLVHGGQGQDLVGINNGGTGFTQTGDDGRLNFKKGETFSKIFKGVHDLELRYRDSGAFVRGKYWYDFELKDESRLFKDISDSNRKEAAQSSGAQILDAFVYHNYSVGDLPGTVRLGKQVVSWGESTFIGNSINSINPLDAAAFRRPGAEIKEG